MIGDTSVPAVCFQQGISNYLSGNFTNAAGFFQAAALKRLAPGAWCNLGNAEWLAGRVGPAILAWERARWLDPYLESARNNLDFARKTERLDLPEPGWTELCSAWLPSAWWPWLAALFLWSAVAAALWPNSAHPAKTNWRQGLVAGGLAGFLLVLPGLAGIHERTKLGVMLTSPAPLRLAPAPHGQAIALLSAGEVVRRERQEGGYYMVRTANDVAGWVAATQVVWIAGSP